MITFAEVPLGEGGEIACALCRRATSEPVPRAVDQVLEQITRISAHWSAGPGPNLAFVGFEPFAHPDLPRIVSAAAAAAGATRIRLRTDAGALAHAGNAHGVLSAGVHHFEVTMLAGVAEEHDRLSGRPGLFAAATQGMAAVRAAAATHDRVVISGRIPLCRHNGEAAAQTVSHLASCGAIAVHLVADDLPAHCLPAVQAALDTATINGMAGFVSGPLLSTPGAYAYAPWVVASDAS